MGPLGLFLLSLWSLPVTRSASNATLTSETELTFSHHLVLDREERVQLSWLPDTQGVTFRYSVATHGYIGLGFSPGGGMHGADIMLAWVDTGGHVHVTDRHAVGNNVPYLDTSQDYHLISGYENDTHTVVTFSRAWDTCDDQDLALGQDTARLILILSNSIRRTRGRAAPPSCITASPREARGAFTCQSPPPPRPRCPHTRSGT